MSRLIEPEVALGYEFSPPDTRFDAREVALYALATGAADDPSDERQLRRAYEGHDKGIEPLAGLFGVLALNALLEGMRRGQKTPGLHYGLERVMHAEQTFAIRGALPSSGTLVHRGRVSGIFDKGRHAIVVTSVTSRDPATGFSIESDIASVVRSAGGFGGERGIERADPVPSDRAPDAVIEQKTRENAALLFRLLGDDNPLHADPRASRTFGLRKPILHGMCTLGYATRHVVDALGEGRALERLTVRFSDVVFPGETLVTEAWRAGAGTVAFRVRVKERDKIVLSHGEARMADGATREAAAAPARGRDEVDAILSAIGAHLAKRPALARAIGAVYQFELRDSGRAFVIDMSHEPGSVREGRAERADCTLELDSADFLRLQRGEVLGKALYLTGALKMTGKTELASHLDFMREATHAAAEAPRAPLAERDLAQHLAPSSTELALTLDVAGEEALTVLLGAAPRVEHARDASSVATLRMKRETFEALAAGKTTLRSAFMHGTVRVDGDMTAARALDRALSGLESEEDRST